MQVIRLGQLLRLFSYWRALLQWQQAESRRIGTLLALHRRERMRRHVQWWHELVRWERQRRWRMRQACDLLRRRQTQALFDAWRTTQLLLVADRWNRTRFVRQWKQQAVRPLNSLLSASVCYHTVARLSHVSSLSAALSSEQSLNAAVDQLAIRSRTARRTALLHLSWSLWRRGLEREQQLTQLQQQFHALRSSLRRRRAIAHWIAYTAFKMRKRAEDSRVVERVQTRQDRRLKRDALAIWTWSARMRSVQSKNMRICLEQ